MKQRKLVAQIAVILNKSGGILSEIRLAIEFLRIFVGGGAIAHQFLAFFEMTSLRFARFARFTIAGQRYGQLQAIANLSWSEVPRNE